MPTNLVASVSNLLTAELRSRIASGLGLDRTVVEKAVAAAVPALFAALTSLVTKPGGPARLADAVAQQQPGVLANIAHIIGGSGQQDLIESGLGSLSSLLGEGTLSTLGNAVARYAGLGDGGSKSLMGILGPLLIGVLGQQQRASGLDASDLAQQLVSQKDNIVRALPSGFADYLSGTGILDPVTKPSFGYRPRAEPAHSSQWSWALPALAVVAISALGLYMLSHRPTETAETLPQASVESPQSLGGVSFVATDDDARGWVGKPVYSNDNKKIGEILELKRDPANKVTDVYVDTGTFLGVGGTRYRFTSDQLREVRPDGLVLKIGEAEVKGLPQADREPQQ
jgi:Bacterial protein of unknown function (DUF937)/PRC-barrel domain